jgi:hypothetical protein
MDDAETIEPIERPPRRPASSSASSEDGRFQPGQLLADRYRVISLVGRGGMGEVYRASDLTLNQPVALKFLPQAAASRPDLLERFRGEVRIARQVSHPNVCRVYDIGEVEGSALISMEYVDGEDLGSLLRRIGRLPGDKAVEIARKLCAGLAAAHARGVLHRDLKPANIMIDGRGQVLIMDFGLAAVADQVAGNDVRSGTPAYMAPEQLAGREVSERSDIYALGLVLYEMFTGQRAFKNNDRSTLPSTSSIVRDVDPVIERIITRCLQPEPAGRPQSALAVARMLPGGDPLAEALAAGDTPSPELVANSGSTEGLPVPVAVACLAIVIVGIVALSWVAQRRNIVNQTPMELAPEVLAAKGREIASSLGYTQRPVDRAFGWFTDPGYQNYARTQPDAAERRAQMGSNRPPLLYFWYREAPNHLIGAEGGPVNRNYPPAAERGNLEMLLDSSGRLLQFQAWPDDGGPPDQLRQGAGSQEDGHYEEAAPSSPVDFQKLLAAAGLDLARMTAAEPKWVPPSAFDARAAWTTTEGAGAVSDPLRIEAATWQGRVVAFERQLPWQVTPPAEDQLFLTFFGVFLPLVAAVVAWRNLRLGRGDKRGATRLAGFGLACTLTVFLLRSHHVSHIREGFLIFTALRDALYGPVVLWLVYVAFEPYLRRYVPNTLIGWSRLLEGRWRDPVVGGNLLAGVATAVVVSLAMGAGPGPANWRANLPVDLSGSVAWLADIVFSGVFGALLLTLLWLLLRIPARRNWLASVLMVVVTLAVLAPGNFAAGELTRLLLGPGISVVTVAVIIARFGVLAAVAYLVTVYCTIIGAAPWTTSLSAWYARTAMLAIAAILALAIYGFRTTLAGRPLWRDELPREAA